MVIVKDKSLHTATNYYLFSLAMADLVILVLGTLKGNYRGIFYKNSFLFWSNIV
jgi:neuromedin U receptor 1